MIQTNNLVAYRKLHNLKQEDVAKILNMSKTSYSYKETGKQEFRLNEAKILADYFGTTIDDIFFNNLVNI
ncbi:helix-turn-helix transcriptional regulator [Romboutsia sp. 1001713B170131_170501_G6]|uniref:helix-turn-helix transcriptional regulator n=1 Tax=Romboutsia sp. 1001713B170131_170501_G6 TaxID=2787108 RepID=UPI0018AC7E23|nr:helix-turn-helix transcriptional regulator [Romboutsia sp. 1001713B170131_170501_G6]